MADDGDIESSRRLGSILDRVDDPWAGSRPESVGRPRNFTIE
jgi:hypothetical protein